MCPTERPGFEANNRMDGGTCVPTERPGFEANNRMDGGTCVPTERPGFEANNRMDGGTCVLPRALGSRLTTGWKELGTCVPGFF